MISALAIIFVFGVLVVFHELGHLLAAKRVGVLAEKFSVGFGPKIVGVKWGETEYMISAIPFGGYVKLLGELEDEEENERLAKEEGRPVGQPNPRSLGAKTPWQRFQVFIAGPLANLVIAVAVTAGVAMYGIEEDVTSHQPPLIAWVDPGSVADQSGVLTGDLIREINGSKVEDWRDVLESFALTASQPTKLMVLREGKLASVTMPAVGTADDIDMLYRGIYKKLDPVILDLVPGSPAEKAGVQVNDRIAAINGTKIGTWYQMMGVVEGSVGIPLNVELQRGTESLIVEITPVDSQGDGKGKLGIFPVIPTEIKKYGFFGGIAQGFKVNYDLTILTFKTLWGLVAGKVSAKTIGGPLMIADTTAKVAHLGLGKLLAWMSLISLNFFIMNLLPIPVLDGGHIIFLLPEMFTGHAVSARFKVLAFQVGFVMIVSLMVFISYNDIMRMLRF